MNSKRSTPPSLSGFITEHAPGSIKAEIVERWNKRVLARGLHNRGLDGAQMYLADYGKSIGVDKVIGLARQAASQQALGMSIGFWCKAYEMEFARVPDPAEVKALVAATLTALAVGAPLPVAPSPNGKKPVTPDPVPAGKPAKPARPGKVATPVAAPTPASALERLPETLRPGKLAPMQPVDAKHAAGWYVSDPTYWAQPKRFGEKVIITAAIDAVWYQSRSGKLRPSLDPAIDAALKHAAGRFGGLFILESELVYFDVNTHEHMTGAQCAAANAELKQPTAATAPTYCVFDCLYANGQNYTAAAPKSKRLTHAEAIVTALETLRPDNFEMLYTARDTDDKRDLVRMQEKENREGLIFFKSESPYTAGPDTLERCVRVKFVEEFTVYITGLLKSKVPGVAFGGLQVAEKVGKEFVDRGGVGSGFTAADVEQIDARVKAARGKVAIKVTAMKKLTEYGKFMHARFEGFADVADDEEPEAYATPVTQPNGQPVVATAPRGSKPASKPVAKKAIRPAVKAAPAKVSGTRKSTGKK